MPCAFLCRDADRPSLNNLLQQDLADELAKEGITISYKAISNWERNLADPFSSLTDEGREKAMDYINLLHASGMYEKQTSKIISFYYFRYIICYHPRSRSGSGQIMLL